MSFAEFAARADEADKRIAALSAKVAGLSGGGGGASGLEEFKATFLTKLKEMRAVAKQEADEMAALKKANAALEAKNTELEHKVAYLIRDLEAAEGKKGTGADPKGKGSPKVEAKGSPKAEAKGSPKAEAKGPKEDKKGKEKGGKNEDKGSKKEDKKGAKGGKEDGDKALFKAALKEGGKKGQDICGLNEMGGVVFFHLAVQDALGRWDLMEEVMKGFNTEVDETAEDRKGGAGHLCKALLSAGDDSLIIYVHVPKDHAAKTSAKDWAEALRANMGPNTKVLSSTDEFVKVECPADPNNNLYPLKMRDQSIGQGFAFLRKRNLVMEDDDDDDVDYGEMAAGADISWGGADY